MKYKWIVPLFAFAAIVAANTLPLHGQDASFTETIDVRVINLEVVVTDRAGNRVPDLGPEDFEVELDGDPIAVDYFSEIREGRAVARDHQGPPGAPYATAGEPVQTRMLLFIDGAFGMPQAYSQFAQAAAEQMDGLSPEEQIAIIFYNGQELTLLSDWTSDGDQLRSALASLEEDDFFGPYRLRDWRSYQRSIGEELRYVAETGVRGDPATPLADLPEFAVVKKTLERQIDRVSRAVGASLYRFADMEGRKTALLWSGGWPWSSFEFLRTPWNRDLSSARRTETSLGGVVDTANRLGYTLYMADSPINFYGGRSAMQQHDTLHSLADGTGGEAFMNRGSLHAIDGAREDIRSYYWLGLTVDGEGDGDRLKINIKSKRRGLKVRARETWLDLPTEELVSQKVEALAFFSATMDDDDSDTSLAETTPLQLEFGEPTLDRRRARVPLTVGIPLEAITMLPGQDGYSAKLEVRISVIDDDGGLNEMPVVPVEFSGPEPQAGAIYYFDTQLEMRRKNHEVTVAVYDAISGSLLSGRHHLDL